MTIRALCLPIALIALLEAATAAQAQMACGFRDAVIAKLGDKYGETRRGSGLAGQTALFEIWASDVTGSWTILKTAPDGMACIMAVGEGWEDEPPRQKGKPT